MQLKEELIEYGYIRRKGPTGKKQKITSHPFHYRSSEGFDIYVGKNNFQNENFRLNSPPATLVVPRERPAGQPCHRKDER